MVSRLLAEAIVLETAVVEVEGWSKGGHIALIW